MKKLIESVIISLTVPALAWLAGYNFDTRGEWALLSALFTIWVFIGAYSFPRD